MTAKSPRPAPPPEEEAASAIIAMAAHELKNALGGIGMAIGRCEQRLLGGKPVTTDDLAIVRGELRRLSGLVNDLLDGARVDQGAIHLELARVDVAALAHDVVEQFRATHLGRPVTLEQPAAPVLIDADAERLRAVLLNYLENAAKYAPAPSAIAVSISGASGATSGGRVRIAVRDQGPGIPREDQSRLFERFFRAPATAKSTHGLGLGLFLCRAIAEAHGGAAGVDSARDAGATFWLDLPIKPT